MSNLRNKSKRSMKHNATMNQDGMFDVSYFYFPDFGNFRVIVNDDRIFLSTQDLIKAFPKQLGKALSDKTNKDFDINNVYVLDDRINKAYDMEVIDSVDVCILLKHLDPFQKYAMSHWMYDVVFNLIDMNFEKLNPSDILVHLLGNPLYALKVCKHLPTLCDKTE